MENIIYLSLGSNIGNRLEYLQAAVTSLNTHSDIDVTDVSSVYETPAWGFELQDDFYNIVLKAKTTLPPLDLLTICQSTESELLRKRVVRWGPRTIDIDILLYSNVVMDSPDLTIPHPLMMERSFVTIPLAEINPDIVPHSDENVKRINEFISF